MTRIKLHVSYAELRPVAPIFQICELQRLAGFGFTGVPSWPESAFSPPFGKLVTPTGMIEMQQDEDGRGACFTFTSKKGMP